MTEQANNNKVNRGPARKVENAYQRQLDQTAITFSMEAKQIANEAKLGLEALEKISMIRYDNIVDANSEVQKHLGKLERKMDDGQKLIFQRIESNHTSINAKFWIILTSTIAAMFTVIVLLTIKT